MKRKFLFRSTVWFVVGVWGVKEEDSSFSISVTPRLLSSLFIVPLFLAEVDKTVTLGKSTDGRAMKKIIQEY